MEADPKNGKSWRKSNIVKRQLVCVYIKNMYVVKKANHKVLSNH